MTPEETAKRKELLHYLNGEPTLQSLLYDLDLLPEQIGTEGALAEKMYCIAYHWREFGRQCDEIRDSEAPRYCVTSHGSATPLHMSRSGPLSGSASISQRATFNCHSKGANHGRNKSQNDPR